MKYKQKRLLAAVLLLYLIFAATNYYLNLGYFGRFAKLAMMIGVLMTLAYVIRFGVARKDMEEHKRNKGASEE